MLRVLYWLARTKEAVEPNLKSLLSGKLTFSEFQRNVVEELRTPVLYTKVFSGDAMAPTLNDGVPPGQAGEKVVIRRLVSPSERTVFLDDIVVCRDPTDDRRNYVRRVIAMPGEEMVSDDPRDIPFSIPAGHCWVVCDNDKAVEAADSRKFGPLSFDLIHGSKDQVHLYLAIETILSSATSMCIKH
jgi:hypothetical protein